MSDNTIILTSFAYKGGLLVFRSPYFARVDVRKSVRNPWRDPTLRKLTGLDPRIQDFVGRCQSAQKLVQRYTDKAVYYAKAQTSYHLQVGCHGGKHRSVALVELIAAEIRKHIPDAPIVVEHLALLPKVKEVVDETHEAS